MATPEQSAELKVVAESIEKLCDHLRHDHHVDPRTLISCLGVQLSDEILQAYRDWKNRKAVLARVILQLVQNFDDMQKQEKFDA